MPRENDLEGSQDMGGRHGGQKGGSGPTPQPKDQVWDDKQGKACPTGPPFTNVAGHCRKPIRSRGQRQVDANAYRFVANVPDLLATVCQDSALSRPAASTAHW